MTQKKIFVNINLIGKQWRVNMQYIKELERKKLLERFGTTQNVNDIIAIIDFTVETTDSIFKNCKAPIFNSEDVSTILKFLIEGNEVGKIDFIRQMNNKANILKRQEEASKMQNTIETLQALLNGNIDNFYDISKISNKSRIHLMEKAKKIVRQYINELVEEFQKDKKREIEALTWAFDDDVEHLMKGERVKVEERKAYEVLKKIHDGTLK